MNFDKFTRIAPIYFVINNIFEKKEKQKNKAESIKNMKFCYLKYIIE